MTAPAPFTPDLLPVNYEAPLVNPSPAGLYSTVTWVEDGAVPPRWLAGGVRIRPHNYGGESAFGIWAAEWCGDPGDEIKDGTRPDPETDPFEPLTVWAFDQCDPTPASQAEVRVRAQQNLRLREQIAVEREMSARLLADAPAPAQVGDIIAAVSHLEAQLAKTNTTGVIHVTAGAAALAASENLIVRNGGALRTPLGHLWAFGGGYVDGLGTTLVATSPVFGWRDSEVLRDTVEARYNQYIAVAERSVVIGYETAVAAATLT
ncbi:major capsid pentamer protein [Gordonia phage LittleMunchkin]|nr:major capsid pentamer protein [Gordonia phage LittleMunchkin]